MSALVSYEMRTISLSSSYGSSEIRYLKCSPPPRFLPKGTVVLLHDFFRTSYQFRYVIDFFAMSDYITIVPDILDTGTWQRRAIIGQRRSATSMVASGIREFLSITCPENHPIHLVGSDRLGSGIAKEIAVNYPETVVSLTYGRTNSDFCGSVASHMMSLSPSSSRIDLVRAFEHVYKYGSHTNDLVSAADIEEYIDVYSRTGTLLDMQKLFQESAGRDKPARQPRINLPESFVYSDPEIEPEEWALTIIANLNRQITTGCTKQVRL